MIAAFVVVMFFGAGLHLTLQYDSSVDSALRNARTTAKTIGSQAEQTFNETFRVLEGIADVYIHEREHGEVNARLLHELMASKLARIPQVMTFVIRDENQRGVAGARTFPLSNSFGILSGVSRDSRTDIGNGLFVGELYNNTGQGIAAGKWLLPVGMDIVGADGVPLGNVFGVIDVSKFGDFYGTLDVGARARIAMWDEAGTLIAANNNISGNIGSKSQIAAQRSAQLAQAPDKTMEIVEPWTAGEIAVQCHLANAPLFISVVLDAEDFLTSWENLRNVVVIAVPGVVLAMIAFAFIIFDQLRHAEENENDLRKAKAAAEEANDAKSRFLAHMSHEFRTPLNAIMGFSEIIKNKVLGEDVSPAYISYADHIHRSGEHLLNIVNDILDMAKVESGAQPLQKQTVDMRKAVEGAVAFIDGVAKRKNIRIQIGDITGLPGVLGDERFIRQVLINLLSNAVKFSPANGKIEVTASYAQGDSLNVSVADNGPGIEPAILRRLGEPFLQGNPAISQSGQGTGLGLSICKRYMDLLGGKLVIDSTLDRGTIATLRFTNTSLSDTR